MWQWHDIVKENFYKNCQDLENTSVSIQIEALKGMNNFCLYSASNCGVLLAHEQLYPTIQQKSSFLEDFTTEERFVSYLRLLHSLLSSRPDVQRIWSQNGLLSYLIRALDSSETTHSQKIWCLRLLRRLWRSEMGQDKMLSDLKKSLQPFSEIATLNVLKSLLKMESIPVREETYALLAFLVQDTEVARRVSSLDIDSIAVSHLTDEFTLVNTNIYRFLTTIAMQKSRGLGWRLLPGLFMRYVEGLDSTIRTFTDVTSSPSWYHMFRCALCYGVQKRSTTQSFFSSIFESLTVLIEEMLLSTSDAEHEWRSLLRDFLLMCLLDHPQAKDYVSRIQNCPKLWSIILSHQLHLDTRLLYRPSLNRRRMLSATQGDNRQSQSMNATAISQFLSSDSEPVVFLRWLTNVCHFLAALVSVDSTFCEHQGIAFIKDLVTFYPDFNCLVHPAAEEFRLSFFSLLRYLSKNPHTVRTLFTMKPLPDLLFEYCQIFERNMVNERYKYSRLLDVLLCTLQNMVLCTEPQTKLDPFGERVLKLMVYYATISIEEDEAASSSILDTSSNCSSSSHTGLGFGSQGMSVESSSFASFTIGGQAMGTPWVPPLHPSMDSKPSSYQHRSAWSSGNGKDNIRSSGVVIGGNTVGRTLSGDNSNMRASSSRLHRNSVSHLMDSSTSAPLNSTAERISVKGGDLRRPNRMADDTSVPGTGRLESNTDPNSMRLSTASSASISAPVLAVPSTSQTSLSLMGDYAGEPMKCKRGDSSEDEMECDSVHSKNEDNDEDGEEDDDESMDTNTLITDTLSTERSGNYDHLSYLPSRWNQCECSGLLRIRLSSVWALLNLTQIVLPVQSDISYSDSVKEEDTFEEINTPIACAVEVPALQHIHKVLSEACRGAGHNRRVPTTSSSGISSSGVESTHFGNSGANVHAWSWLSNICYCLSLIDDSHAPHASSSTPSAPIQAANQLVASSPVGCRICPLHLIEKTLLLLLAFLRDIKLADNLLTRHAMDLFQSITAVLECREHMDLKYWALCVLQSIASRPHGKACIVLNGDILEKIRFYMGLRERKLTQCCLEICRALLNDNGSSATVSTEVSVSRQDVLTKSSATSPAGSSDKLSIKEVASALLFMGFEKLLKDCIASESLLELRAKLRQTLVKLQRLK